MERHLGLSKEGGYSRLIGFRASTQAPPKPHKRVICSPAAAVSYNISGVLLHLVMDGEYLPDDIRAKVSAAMADPRLQENTLFLMDMRTSQALSERTPDDLRAMANFLGGFSDRFGQRLAMIASAQLHYGLLRMASAFSAMEGFEANVFYEWDEAMDWLRGGP